MIKPKSIKSLVLMALALFSVTAVPLLSGCCSHGYRELSRYDKTDTRPSQESSPGITADQVLGAALIGGLAIAFFAGMGSVEASSRHW
jgi:hypothetical protein